MTTVEELEKLRDFVIYTASDLLIRVDALDEEGNGTGMDTVCDAVQMARGCLLTLSVGLNDLIIRKMHDGGEAMIREKRG